MSPPLFEFETNGEAHKRIFMISFVLLIPDHASSDSEWTKEVSNGMTLIRGLVA